MRGTSAHVLEVPTVVTADDQRIERIARRLAADHELLRAFEHILDHAPLRHEEVNLVNQICSRKKMPRHFY
jgi:hypothetical protein